MVRNNVTAKNSLSMRGMKLGNIVCIISRRKRAQPQLKFHSTRINYERIVKKLTCERNEFGKYMHNQKHNAKAFQGIPPKF